MPEINHIRAVLQSPAGIAYREYAVEKRNIHGKDYMICWVEAQDDARFQVDVELLDPRQFPPTKDSRESCFCRWEKPHVERLISGMFIDGNDAKAKFLRMFDRPLPSKEVYAYPPVTKAVLGRLISKDDYGVNKAVYPRFKDVDILDRFDKLTLDAKETAQEIGGHSKAMGELAEALADAKLSGRTDDVLPLIQDIKADPDGNCPVNLFGPGSILVSVWRVHVTADFLPGERVHAVPKEATAVSEDIAMLIGFDKRETYTKPVRNKSFHIPRGKCTNGKFEVANFVFFYRGKENLRKRGLLQKPPTSSFNGSNIIFGSDECIPTPTMPVPTAFGEATCSHRDQESYRKRSAGPSPPPTVRKIRKTYNRYEREGSLDTEVAGPTSPSAAYRFRKTENGYERDERMEALLRQVSDRSYSKEYQRRG